MKKACVLGLLLVLLSAGNCFAVTFQYIDMLSYSNDSGWYLSTDIMLSGAVSPTVQYKVDSDSDTVLEGPYTMPLISAFGTPLYLDEISARYPTTIPSDFNGKTFEWFVIDTNSLFAKGVVSGLRYVPVSTNLALCGNILTWSNSDTNLDQYRVRVLDSTGSTALGTWTNPASQGTEFDFTNKFNFLPGEDYIIRVEARDLGSFDLLSVMGAELAFGLITNRSTALLNYTAPVPEPATMLLLASGLVGLAGLRRKFKK